MLAHTHLLLHAIPILHLPPSSTAAPCTCRACHAFMRQFPFFQLWPDSVQRQLSRVLLTEVRVRHETIISRGSPQSKIFFVLSGRVSLDTGGRDSWLQLFGVNLLEGKQGVLSSLLMPS